MTQLITRPSEFQFAEATDGDGLYEVVNGQRVELPPMGAYGTWIATSLLLALGPFVKTHHLGRAVTEMLFALDPGRDLERRPDVAFVSAQRWPLHRQVPDTHAWEVVPELAVEVISPTDVMKDVVAKVREYFETGVLLVWVVLPTEKRIYVYESPTRIQVLTPADELDGGRILPGLRLPVAPLFDDVADTEGRGS